MHLLKPFENAVLDFTLEADAIRSGKTIKLIYKLSDTKNSLNLPLTIQGNQTTTSRIDGLWNNTCFEMFLRRQGETSYHEFNFALTPAWNQYHFTEYRKPQPPRPCYDYVLEKLFWNNQTLEVELSGLDDKQTYNLSLTAVIKTKLEKTHYLALKHPGHEADFHQKDSFILIR